MYVTYFNREKIHFISFPRGRVLPANRRVSIDTDTDTDTDNLFSD